MTINQLAKLLQRIEADESPSINFALHDFIRYLMHYSYSNSNSSGKNAADMLLMLEQTEETSHEKE